VEDREEDSESKTEEVGLQRQPMVESASNGRLPPSTARLLFTLLLYFVLLLLLPLHLLRTLNFQAVRHASGDDSISSQRVGESGHPEQPD
jgi:hypothetical protein